MREKLSTSLFPVHGLSLGGSFELAHSNNNFPVTIIFPVTELTFNSSAGLLACKPDNSNSDPPWTDEHGARQL